MNVCVDKVFRRDRSVREPPKQRQLPDMSHDVSKWTLEKLLVGHLEQRRSGGQKIANLADHFMKPRNLIMECRERLRPDGVTAAEEERTGIAQQARHVPQNLDRGARLVARRETGIVRRRVA